MNRANAHRRRFIKTFEERSPDPGRDSALVLRCQHLYKVPGRLVLGCCLKGVTEGLLTELALRRVQEFLLKSEAAFRSHPVWASAPPEHQQQAIEVNVL